MKHGGDQSMMKVVKGEEKFQVSMQEPKQAGAKRWQRCRAVNDLCQDNEEKEVATQEFDVV